MALSGQAERGVALQGPAWQAKAKQGNLNERNS